MRPRLTTICFPLASGVAPPQRPVLPPCGTIAVCVSAHALTIAPTSAVEPGRTTASGIPT